MNMFVEMEAASLMCAVKVGQIGRVIEVWDNHFSFPFMCRTEGGHMINHTNKGILSPFCATKILWAFFFEQNITAKILMIVTDRRSSLQWLIFICIWWTDDGNSWWCVYLKAALQHKSQLCKYTDERQLYSYVPRRAVPPYDDWKHTHTHQKEPDAESHQDILSS